MNYFLLENPAKKEQREQTQTINNFSFKTMTSKFKVDNITNIRIVWRFFSCKTYLEV